MEFKINSKEPIYTQIMRYLKKGIETEPIRIDEITGKKFTFFKDPDNLPLEVYEK